MLTPSNTYGAILIGVVIAGILYGATCVQTCYYILHYPKDPWYIKLLVAILFVLDSCHQAVITHTIYTNVITRFGEELGVFVWTGIGEIFFNALTILLVQCFLTMRIWTLSNRNMLVTGSTLVFVLAEFLVAIIFAAKAMRFTANVELVTLKPLCMAIDAVGAAGDVVITGYFCYFLQKSRTGFRSSESLVNKLILFSINTTLLTSLCAILSLVSYNVWPKTWIYIAFYFCLGRLYCNTFLSTLNARKLLKDGLQDNTLPLVFKPGHSSSSEVGTQMPLSKNITIKIDTAKELIRDVEPVV